ncbi:glycosyltransferase family A protein [Nocardia sp. CDC160]|uniref:glycosyltransferase family A protein n=1 Tax=Nocardia sp. CDC160 TaxID=3112166 RepID=UPI002DC006B8|nr:glycosyltransferase family A protein [Nocardia sp. CDC160]MEC3920237.1 glycosyltransferase family A protein [Nocardia sp. CDC160]
MIEPKVPSCPNTVARRRFGREQARICYPSTEQASVGDVTAVITALNDATDIPYCLDRLTRQEAIAQIIVVDRGSVDDTQWIVGVYSSITEKIRLITEPGLELVAARNLGFDAADSDIIGHLRPDARVEFDWARTTSRHLSTHPETAAVTRTNLTHIGLKIPTADADRQTRHRSQIFDLAAGWPCGANLAIRRSVWLEIRDTSVTVSVPWADLDLALCLRRQGRRVDQLVPLC